MDLDNLTEVAIAAAAKLGTDDAVALAVDDREKILRFANNSVTVVTQTEETELMVYLAKDGRTAIAITTNPVESDVRAFVGELFSSLKGLPPTDQAPLPSKSVKHLPTAGSHDEKITKAADNLPELARQAIDASLQAGGKRSAGIISASTAATSLLASNGTSGTDSRAEITLNIRAFSDQDASGHGLSCSSTMSGFNPTEAGRRAGEDAKRMAGAVPPEAADYEVLFSPTVASNLVECVVRSSSAFAVEAGMSYLADKAGKSVASSAVTLTDHGRLRGALGGRSFDDEGMATGSTSIIEHGQLQGFLHNLTTAKRWKTSTTGNAGILSPHPWNIEVAAGNASFDEMVGSMKKGIVLTSNWYTRFKNYRTGEFSTVPRDGAFLVENGRLVKPLKGMRVSDDLERLFSSVRMLSKDREWIQWWEVDTPTLCPWMLMDGVRITRAFE